MSFDTQYPNRKDWRNPERDKSNQEPTYRYKHQKSHLIQTELLSEADTPDEWLFGMSEELDVEYFVEMLTNE